MKRTCICLTAIAICLVAETANAQSRVGSRQYGAPNAVGRGVTEIGLDNLWILSYADVGDSSAFRMTLVSGPTVRRFVKDNFSVNVNVSALFARSGEDDRDLGAIATVGASYYLRLGSGMFLAPSAAVGGLYATRRTPLPGSDTTVSESTLAGGVATLELPFVFYAWKVFNLRAGLSIRFSSGSVSAEGSDEGLSFFNADGGLSVGGAYYF